MFKVSLAQLLNVTPAKTIKYLVVSLGTEVKKGDPLAIKKDFWGKVTKIVSEIDGTLITLSSQTGELEILEKAEAKNANQEKPPKPVKNKTTTHGKGVQEKTLKGILGFGTSEGEAVFIDNNLEFTKLKPALKDKIILAVTLIDAASIFKASALGIKGIVVGSADENILQEAQEKLAHDRDFGFLLLGKDEEKNMGQILKKWEGKKVRVDGEGKELLQLT